MLNINATNEQLIASLVSLNQDHEGDEMPLWEDQSTGADITIRTAMEDPEMRQRALTTLLEWSRATVRNATMVGAIAIELARRFEIDLDQAHRLEEIASGINAQGRVSRPD